MRKEVCIHCGSTSEFWLIEFKRSWVKVNSRGQLVTSRGQVVESHIEPYVYQCANCETIYEEDYLGNLPPPVLFDTNKDVKEIGDSSI